MWRLEPARPTVSLMIEATNDHFTLPEKGLVGHHAIFDPAMLDTPRIDDAFKALDRMKDGKRRLPWPEAEKVLNALR